MADNVKRRYSRCWKTRRRRCQGQTLHPGTRSTSEAPSSQRLFRARCRFCFVTGSVVIIVGIARQEQEHHRCPPRSPALRPRALNARASQGGPPGAASAISVSACRIKALRRIRARHLRPSRRARTALLTLCHPILRPSRPRNPQHRHYSEPPGRGTEGEVRCVRRACVHPPTHSSC